MTALEPRSWPLKSSFLVFQTIHIEVKFKTSQFYNFIAIFNWISNCMSTSSILLEAWQNISTIMVSSSEHFAVTINKSLCFTTKHNPLNVFTYIDIYWKKKPFVRKVTTWNVKEIDRFVRSCVHIAFHIFNGMDPFLKSLVPISWIYNRIDFNFILT